MMDCSLPPPLSDDQLSEALDGDTPPEVAAHLAGCPACAARLARASRIESSLRGSLYRWDCPAPERLGEYHLAMVSQEEQRAILRHLDDCPSCTAELETLSRFLAADDAPRAAPSPAARPPTPPRTRLRELVARLLPAAPVTALRGVRSETFSAAAGATTIMLDVQRTPTGQVTVQGQVLDDTPERWTGALVELRQGGALVGTAAVDDVGGFHFTPLAAAPLELRITPAHGASILWRDIDLGSSL